jgi:hypothetical protein
MMGAPRLENLSFPKKQDNRKGTKTETYRVTDGTKNSLDA